MYVKAAQNSPGSFLSWQYSFILYPADELEETMNIKQHNTKKIIIALVLLIISVAVLWGIYQATIKSPVQGDKTITVEVIHKDGSLISFEYHTDREYLGETLTDEGLVSGESGAYGMFITTVDGETADDSRQEWWCITKNQEQLNTSADQTPIADGEKYELTLTTGY